MTEPIIRVEGLGKRYRIGAHEKPALTRQQAILSTLGLPFKYLSQMMRPPSADEIIWALRDISLQVEAGEVVGIIGRNGAGKSTLLKILSRITDPTVGRAVLHGRVGSLLEVGTGFHPDLTGRENAYLSGAILGMKKREIDRKFDEIVAFSEMDKFIDTPVKRYSSGMYVRLAFAVAAHLEPEILIVDEVLSVGDLAFQNKCLGKLSDTAHSGRTVLFVSHNMPMVMRLCTRGVLLSQGHVQVDGTPSEAVKSYVTNVLGANEIQSWENQARRPGSEQIRLAYVGVFDRKGDPIFAVDIREPVEIRVGYFVGKPNLKFRCAFNLFAQGTTAFTTMETAEMERSEVGYYESSVTIPGNLLAEGDYAVDVSMFTSRGVKQRYVYLSSALVFQVYDPMAGDSARGDYAMNYAGVVRPALPWQMRYVGAELAPISSNLQPAQLPPLESIDSRPVG